MSLFPHLGNEDDSLLREAEPETEVLPVEKPGLRPDTPCFLLGQVSPLSASALAPPSLASLKT